MDFIRNSSSPSFFSSLYANYFQNANSSKEAVYWQEWSYKEGDPILFNDTARFSLLYNNLKGRIIKIDKESDRDHQ